MPTDGVKAELKVRVRIVDVLSVMAKLFSESHGSSGMEMEIS